MKTCRKCRQPKPLEAFYKHKRMADGHLNECIECSKAKMRETRAKNLAYYREYDRNRSDDPDRVARRRAYRASPEQRAAYIQRDKEKYPEKYKARFAASNAIHAGSLKPKPCERCGYGVGVNAHHEDYSKPLEVIWLCKRCHGQRHREINAERRKTA